MKLATFSTDGLRRLGVVMGEEIADLAAADETLPRDMTALLRLGAPGLEAAWRVAQKCPRLPLAAVRLHAPVPEPPNIFAIGMNYADHIAEARKFPQFRDMPDPEYPIWFPKTRRSINGPFDPIWRPRVSDTLDYEGELGVVIGRACRHVPKERAREVIAGFLVVNDATIRGWIAHAPTLLAAKGFETTCPMGPWLVTADEVGDPHDLRLCTWVNDELRQDSNTGNMIFDVYDQIAYLSTVCTLEPGDIISTGTPLGVGGFGDKPRWLKPGDVVTIEIEGIGRIANPVVDEPPDSVRL